MAGERETVLIVEDDRALAVGLDLNLSDEGYRVLVARDGEEGLRRALEERPDLIVLDLMLPERDGFELLRELRERGRDMPVIILSARGEETDKVRGLGIGADDYVTKPFSLAELIARIEATLRRERKARAQNARTRLGQVEIDRVGRRVYRGGEEITLTGREFDLLEHFLDNAGRVESRERLLAAVWGYDYSGTARTVDNFVRSLRVKLEVDPSAPRHFVTVHGAGYRFDP